MKRGCRRGLSSSTDPTSPIGRIGRPHGVRGEVTVVADPDDHPWFAPGSVVTTQDGDSLEILTASPFRDRGLIVAFAGVGDRDAAERLRGTVLVIPASQRRALDEGEHWPDDLVGLTAISPDGHHLGDVIGVLLGDHQDRLVVVTPDGVEVQVPFVEAIVGDPADGRIVIDPPDGLFP